MSLTRLAKDLSKDVPRSPREMLGGYVVLARMLDKCRAVLNGTNDEYHYNCPLDQLLLEFTGIDAEAFKDFVATGADDEAVVQWVAQHAKEHSREEIVRWNNDLRYKRISEMSDELQVFLEDYIPEYVTPKGKVVYHWFDVYDIEEGRI